MQSTKATETSTRRPSRWKSLGVGVAILGAGVLWVRKPVSDWLVRRTIVSEEAPAPEVLREALENAPDRVEAIHDAWATGRIQQRTVAIDLAGKYLKTGVLDAGLMAIIREGVADPDFGVREVAMSAMASVDPKGLLRAVSIQLGDPDPLVQLLGLQYLRRLDPTNGISLAIKTLGQSDRLVAVSALRILTLWGGQDFGAKMAETIGAAGVDGGPGVVSDEVATKIDAKLDLARTWWREHAREFVSAAQLSEPLPSSTPTTTLPAGNFTVTDLEGHAVHLADFRGKTVVVNFWTTWCTACVGELPELVMAQSRHPDEVVVLGVSLDAVPDEHGHLGGHVEVGGQEREHGHEHEHPNLPKIRAQVTRVKEQRKLNYRLALDETGAVSGKYNGGELPTTLIIDAQGQIRRRYVGPRTLPVLEALIAEAGRPPGVSSGRAVAVGAK